MQLAIFKFVIPDHNTCNISSNQITIIELKYFKFII